MIMDYVNQFIQENGYSPSVREIGAAVGLRSTASVSYRFAGIAERGCPARRCRQRMVTGARPGQIPIVGVVTAGFHSGGGKSEEQPCLQYQECFALPVGATA